MNRPHPIVRRWIAPPKLPEPINPALAHHAEQRAAATQNRIADTITRFSGSMARRRTKAGIDAAWGVHDQRDESTHAREVKMQVEHSLAALTLVASVPTVPRLSRRAGFWAIAFAFLSVTALSTAPSALYGLYERHEHFSPITITLVYAVYAAGVTASLLLAGHVSDWYGRKAVLIPALTLAVAAAALFISWHSLTGLLVARVMTGLAEPMSLRRRAR